MKFGLFQLLLFACCLHCCKIVLVQESDAEGQHASGGSKKAEEGLDHRNVLLGKWIGFSAQLKNVV